MTPDIEADVRQARGEERTRLVVLACGAMRGLAEAVRDNPADLEGILFRWHQVFMAEACPDDPRVHARRLAAKRVKEYTAAAHVA